VPRYGAMADINMTPFIDVMLVLLIIFMVAAPLLTSGVAVDLPQAKAGALNVEQKPIAIALDDQGQLFLMDQPIAEAELVDKLQALAADGADHRIYLRASKVVPYGRVAEIMGAVTAAGYKKVALVTEPEKR
jgi:biopolymer transport protein TolR